jgi:chromosome segregation ATPase
MNNQERLRELEDKLAELKARLPAHSVSAAMMIELEELEEEIEALRARVGDEQD